MAQFNRIDASTERSVLRLVKAGAPKTEIARECRVGRMTVYRVLERNRQALKAAAVSLILLFGALLGKVQAAEQYALDLPPDIRAWFRNPDGSCVQCSLGMCGVDQNDPATATLLYDTPYGPKERGGSGPARVSNYARQRGMKIWNITGSSTFDWMRWACATGRGAAIGAGRAHFQTLVGHDPANRMWYVCNNNSTHRIDKYTDDEFRRLHLSSGQWVVVLQAPPHPARPRYVQWWESNR